MNKIVAEHFSVEVEPVSGFGVGLDAITTSRTTVRATFTNLSDSLTPFRYRVEGTDSRMYIEDEPVVEFKYTRAGLIGTTFTVFFRDQNGETVSDSYTMHYHVYRYDEPKVVPAIAGASDIVCRRCNGSGEASATGGSVRITAARNYSAVKHVSGAKQVNFCTIRYRWKEATVTDYGAWAELLSANSADTDIVDVVLNLGLSVAMAYDIQVGVVDTAGGTHEVTRRIPTARTPFHLGKGGKNIGLGGFCDYSRTEAIDAFWDAWFHKGLEVLGDLTAKGDAQFSGDVSVDGLLTLNGCIGIREVFSATGSTGWSGGQLLSEAFPDADMTLLEQGTLFVAVLRNVVSYIVGTGIKYVTRREPVLCARVTGSVAGGNIDTISGCAVMFSNISGNYAPRCQHSYQFNIAKSGEDYLLESDYLRIYDATDYVDNGDTVLQPSQGIQKISSDSITIDALYVIL